MRTCLGCATDVEIDPRTGEVRTSDGLTGTTNFADEDLVVWQCPDCEYPHVDDTRR